VPTLPSLPAGDGVLPNQWLAAAIDEGILDAGAFTIPPANIQPASVDLRLGEVCYRMRCSFLPDRDAVKDRMDGLVLEKLDLHRDGVVLEPGRPYLIPLKEQLALPATFRGKANPKSSTGRLDVFTRLITDGSYRFDEISPGYHGGLYLEVVPLSFPIRVREDLTLNQLRLSVGHHAVTDDEIRALHQAEPLLYEQGRPVSDSELAVGNGLFLSLDLRGDGTGGWVGYRARENTALLDLTRAGPFERDEYWERVKREEGGRIVLSPKRFYLLLSREAVTIPPTLAAEMTAYDPTSGELRTHYAGFFDPGFGYDPRGGFHGSRAALEVRAHDVPFMIEHGQPVCKLTFERMLAAPTALYGPDIGSSYQQQEDTLGKHFSPAGPVSPVSPVSPTDSPG
jgi:dCTP deaminase